MPWFLTPGHTSFPAEGSSFSAEGLAVLQLAALLASGMGWMPSMFQPVRMPLPDGVRPCWASSRVLRTRMTPSAQRRWQAPGVLVVTLGIGACAWGSKSLERSLLKKESSQRQSALVPAASSGDAAPQRRGRAGDGVGRAEQLQRRAEERLLQLGKRVETVGGAIANDDLLVHLARLERKQDDMKASLDAKVDAMQASLERLLDRPAALAKEDSFRSAEGGGD